MSTLRLAGLSGLLIASALVGGTIIGSVAAATMPGVTDLTLATPGAAASAPAKTAEACAAFRRAFAAKLGVDESALVPAAKAAAITTIDAAVAAGTMTREAGDRRKARIGKADGAGCALLAGRIGSAKSGVAGGGTIARDGLTVAAKALGISPAELGADLRGGKTLRDLAAAKGVPYDTIVGGVTAAVKSKLDAAVAGGTLAQAREDRILQRLQRNLIDGRLRNARPRATSGPSASPAPTGGS